MNERQVLKVAHQDRIGLEGRVAARRFLDFWLA